jgi:hypothetical protein
MQRPVIVGVTAIVATAILGGSAVAVAEVVTSPHSDRPVAAAAPAPTKTIIKHDKKVEHKTVVVPAPASNGSAPATGQAPINDLRQVSPGVYANQNTSDAFAQSVVSAWDGSPGVQEVYSPVTGQSYAMTYTPQPDGTVIATGGNSAYVQF